MNDKTDKGFELFYWNLSNRRKFIRNLWLWPLLVLLALGLYLKEQNGIFVAIAIGMAAIAAWQLYTTYTAWKKEEQHPSLKK